MRFHMMSAFSASIIIIVILLSLLPARAATPSSYSGGGVELRYKVRYWNGSFLVLVGNQFLDKYCPGKQWSVYYDRKIMNGSNGKIVVVNSSIILLRVPEEFNVNVSLNRVGRWEAHANVTVTMRGALVYGARIRLNFTGGNVSIEAWEIEELCRANITYTLRIDYLASLLPVSSLDGMVGVEPMSLYVAAPRVLGNLSVALVSTLGSSVCSGVLMSRLTGTPPAEMESLDYTPILLGPPPGEEYKCCGIEYASTETMVPLSRDMSLDEQQELTRQLVENITRATGVSFKERRLEFSGFTLIDYIGRVASINSTDIMAVISQAKATGNSPGTYMVYQAQDAFLLKLGGTDVVAMNIIRAAISEAFHTRYSLAWPVGGECDILASSIDELPTLLASEAASGVNGTLLEKFAAEVLLIGQSVPEPPRTVVELPGSAGPVSAWWAAGLLGAALAILVAVLRLKARKSRS